MAIRNFVIARTEEEAQAMADSDGGADYGTGFETIEEARRNLQNIMGLVQFLPPTHGGTDYRIYHVIRYVILIP